MPGAENGCSEMTDKTSGNSVPPDVRREPGPELAVTVGERIHVLWERMELIEDKMKCLWSDVSGMRESISQMNDIIGRQGKVKNEHE